MTGAISPAKLPSWLTRGGLTTEAAPKIERQGGEANDDELTAREGDDPDKGGVHEAVGMETDAEHVDAEPAPARDDITKDGERHQSPLFHKTAPATVQNYGIPKYNDEGAIFFGIPAPEAAP